MLVIVSVRLFSEVFSLRDFVDFAVILVELLEAEILRAISVDESKEFLDFCNLEPSI